MSQNNTDKILETPVGFRGAVLSFGVESDGKPSLETQLENLTGNEVLVIVSTLLQILADTAGTSVANLLMDMLTAEVDESVLDKLRETE
jgi:hypothetical protein